MKRTDAFSSCHPAVNVLYFALVLVCSMCILQPVMLAVSLGCAFAYACRLRGGRAARFSLCWLLPMMAAAALINPAFNHAGATILTYLPTGNPLTLESILYGLAAAGMLAAVVLWFLCLSEVLNADKLVWLFGRVIPVFSLLLSMTLRFLPKFKAQFDAVRAAQKNLGRDIDCGGLFSRVRAMAAVFSMMVTWSLENAVETADSMKGRGYGLPGRTAFSIYRMDGRSRAALAWLAFCGGGVLVGWAAGGISWHYYPVVSGAPFGAVPLGISGLYLLLCLTPLILDAKEESRWRCVQSKT